MNEMARQSAVSPAGPDCALLKGLAARDTGVLAIVVSYNTRDLTLRAIGSLHGQSPAPRIVVADNASIDGSADAIARDWPDIDLLRSDANLGFGRAVNLAAATASARWILLLNPDAELEEGALENLVACAEAHPGHGIYGGRTLHAGGQLNPHSCGARITPWSAACLALGLTRVFRGSPLFDSEAMGGWQRDTMREVDIVFGCFSLIRRDVWDALGGFDARYWLYGEDADLCLRSAALLGKRPLFVPTAVARHIGGASSGDSASYRMLIAKGRQTVMRQHWPRRWQWLARPLGLAWAGLRAAADTIRDNLAYARRRGAASSGCWREVWRRRDEWLNGY